MLFVLKALVSGLIVAVVSEVAKRSPALGALIVSLPLVSILSVMWLWGETGDRIRVADHVQATFWYVLPSLPMFLLFPAMIRSGMSVWLALSLSAALTVALYVGMTWVLGRFGIGL
jgi:hypothetical protein